MAGYVPLEATACATTTMQCCTRAEATITHQERAIVQQQQTASQNRSKCGHNFESQKCFYDDDYRVSACKQGERGFQNREAQPVDEMEHKHFFLNNTGCWWLFDTWNLEQLCRLRDLQQFVTEKLSFLQAKVVGQNAFMELRRMQIRSFRDITEFGIPPP